MKKSFLNYDKPLLTAMVQGTTIDRIKYLMDRSREDGADAFGMQFERLLPEYKTKETLHELFEYAGDLPVYYTNYRVYEGVGKSDETLAKEMLEYAELGGTLCDVMGDMFDPSKDELTTDENAIKKQKELIDKLHEKGAEVIMSSHVNRYITAERALEIALEHQKRGADISKIVTQSDTMAEQIENMRIIDVLKQKLDIPFLFLTCGECRIQRRVCGELGCCMYLCVHEHDGIATPAQPLIKNIIAIREN